MSKKGSKVVTLDAEVLVQRELALMVECNGVKTWVPRSQCEYDEEDGTLQMPEWLAVEKGFV